MRFKIQRPMKSSRHKSVISLDYIPQTLFVNNVGTSSPIKHEPKRIEKPPQHIDHYSHHYNHHHNHNHNHNHHHHQQQKLSSSALSTSTTTITPVTLEPTTTTAATTLDAMKYIGHMDEVMRLAFLENNELSPELPSTDKDTNHQEFRCDEPDCGKLFPSLRKLRHHKVVHSNEFPYSCQFKGCDKRFKRKFGIDLHSTTHFDLDPDMYTRTSNNNSMRLFGRRLQYSMCKQCDVKFKTVHEYQVHMIGHGKEPFKCPVRGCGQSFSIWKSFQKHRASHYFNYYCRMNDQCDHHTSNLQLLKLHIYCCHFNRKLPLN